MVFLVYQKKIDINQSQRVGLLTKNIWEWFITCVTALLLYDNNTPQLGRVGELAEESSAVPL